MLSSFFFGEQTRLKMDVVMYLSAPSNVISCIPLWILMSSADQ